MKKAIAMFLTLAMGVSMLAGCGNSSTTTAGGESAAGAAESVADSGETPTLTFSIRTRVPSSLTIP